MKENYVDIVSERTVNGHSIYTVQVNEDPCMYIEVSCCATNLPFVCWNREDWENRAELSNAWTYNITIMTDANGNPIVSDDKLLPGKFTADAGYAARIIDKVLERRRESDIDLLNRAYACGISDKANKDNFFSISGECMYAIYMKRDTSYVVDVIPRYGEIASVVLEADGKITQKVPELVQHTIQEIQYAIKALKEKKEKESKDEKTNSGSYVSDYVFCYWGDDR